MKVINSHSLFFLKEGEKVSNVYIPLTRSIFDLKNIENHREAYNIVCAFNVLHMMSPPQCDELIRLMHNFLKPEGYAFVEVHTISNLPFIIDIFMQEKKKNSPAPGYLMVDRFIFRQVNTITKAQENCGIHQVNAYPTNDYSLLSGIESPGFYREKQTETMWELDRKPSKDIIIYKRKSHMVMHVFDRETLSQYLTKNGFEVKEVFYIESEGYKVDENLTADNLKENSYALGLIARKISEIFISVLIFATLKDLAKEEDVRSWLTCLRWP